MSTRILQSLFVLVVGLGSLAGCSQGNPARPKGVAAKALPPAKPTITPEAALNTVLDGLRSSKPAAAWDVLPTTFQTTLDSTVREIADAIDPEVWERTVRVFKKLPKLLETKKDFILKSPMWLLFPSVKRDDVKAHWGEFVALLQTICDSELTNIEKLKHFEGRAFLEGSGSKLYAQFRDLSKMSKDDVFHRLDGIKVTIKDSNETSANAELSGPKLKPVKVTLVADQGRWVAAQAGLLGLSLSQFENRIVGLFRPYRLMEWKADYLHDLDGLEKGIDRLLAAKTSDEFQAAFGKQVIPVVLRWNRQIHQKREPLTEIDQIALGRTKDTALILVTGIHFGDEPAMRTLMTQFQALSKQAAAGQLIGPKAHENEKMTMFLLTPVTDIQALAKSINVGKVAKIDAKRNTLIIEVPAAPSADKEPAGPDSKAEASAK